MSVTLWMMKLMLYIGITTRGAGVGHTQHEKWDNITADEIRPAGGFGVDIWNLEQIPNQWSRSIIVPTFKKKDKTVCDNYG